MQLLQVDNSMFKGELRAKHSTERQARESQKHDIQVHGSRQDCKRLMTVMRKEMQENVFLKRRTDLSLILSGFAVGCLARHVWVLLL